MVSSDACDFDRVFTALGWRGKYQVIQFALAAVHVLPFAFNMSSIIFIGYAIDTTCKEVNNTLLSSAIGDTVDLDAANITYGKCSIGVTGNWSGEDESLEVPCINGFNYAEDIKHSLSAEWGLLCEKTALSDFLQTLLMIGMGLGAVAFTGLSDRRGRGFSTTLSGLCLLVTSTAMAFVPSYAIFAVLRVAQGASQMGQALTASTLTIEMVPTKFRSTIALLLNFMWSFAVVTYAVAAYLLRDVGWRNHQLAVGCTSIAFLLFPCMLNESCRWLAAKRKYKAVERTLTKAARLNGKDKETILSLFREALEGQPLQKQSTGSKADVHFELVSDINLKNRLPSGEQNSVNVDVNDLPNALDKDNGDIVSKLNEDEEPVDNNAEEEPLVTEKHLDNPELEGTQAEPQTTNSELNRHSKEVQDVSTEIGTTEKTPVVTINGTEFPETEAEPLTAAADGTTSSGSVSQIFKDRQIFLLSCIIWFMWFTDTITYYGLNLISTEIHSNKYLGFGLMSLMEVPSALAFCLTVDRFGRNRSCIFFHVLGGSSLLLAVIFNTFKETTPSFSIAVTVLSLLGKFSINTTFNIIWLYTPEIYPTTVRNFGFGLACFVSRLGGIIAPFTRTLYQSYPWAPGSVFGACCILVALIIHRLPETKGQELPQTVPEMKQWLHKQKSAKKNKKH